MIWNFFSSDVQSSVEEVVVGKEFCENTELLLEAFDDLRFSKLC